MNERREESRMICILMYLIYFIIKMSYIKTQTLYTYIFLLSCSSPFSFDSIYFIVKIQSDINSIIFGLHKTIQFYIDQFRISLINFFSFDFFGNFLNFTMCSFIRDLHFLSLFPPFLFVFFVFHFIMFIFRLVQLLL